MGNMMGDFVKGRLEGRFTPGVRRGVELHRKIDSFAAQSELFRRSKRRIGPSFGHYRGVLVDLYYDHFLAAEWDAYAAEPLSRFIHRCDGILREHEDILPEQMQKALPLIFGEWMPVYGEVEGIEQVLRRMSQRIGHPNPLGEGAVELRARYGELRLDFQGFMAEVTEYARQWRDSGR